MLCITGIAPVKSQEGYEFSVTLMDNKDELSVKLNAHELINHALFQEAVLKKTGKMYYLAQYVNWFELIDSQLKKHWHPEKEKKVSVDSLFDERYLTDDSMFHQAVS